MIDIDGSYLEGGGQILRTALALSTLTQQPFRCFNIRKGRCKGGGLKNQHLYCIKALEQLCDAKATGAEVGSNEITYTPGPIKAKNLNIDVETAGSTTLLLQSLLLPSLFADNQMKIKITGGTDVNWSMPYDYFKNILIPHVEPFVESIEVNVLRRGFFPKGGGQIELKIKPKYKISNYENFEELTQAIRKDLKPLDLTQRGNLLEIQGSSIASETLQKAEVAERQVKGARRALSTVETDIKIEKQYTDTYSTGTSIFLQAIYDNTILGADALGEKQKRAEVVGKEAGENLLKEINADGALDSHLCDNILPYMALRKGQFTTTRVSNHCKTNIWTIEKFLNCRFNIDGNKVSLQ